MQKFLKKKTLLIESIGADIIEKQKLKEMETEYDKLKFNKDEIVQQKRYDIKLEEDAQRKKNLMEVTKQNVDAITHQQYHGLTPKEFKQYQQNFDKKLLHKVGLSQNVVNQKETLQKTDTDVIMGPFEKNTTAFKDQFHRRLLMQSKIFDHQSVSTLLIFLNLIILLIQKSPEKNHAIYEVERANKLIEQANNSMMKTEHVRDEKVHKQKQKRIAHSIKDQNLLIVNQKTEERNNLEVIKGYDRAQVLEKQKEYQEYV